MDGTMKIFAGAAIGTSMDGPPASAASRHNASQRDYLSSMEQNTRQALPCRGSLLRRPR
jgi:hypothetical protein